MKRLLFFMPAIGWIIICTILLTLPGSSFPKEDWLDKIWFDKWVHIGLFAAIVVTWSWGVHKGAIQNPSGIFFWITIAAILYGTGMEFVQKYLVVNRSFDGADIIADAVGAYTGYLFSRKVFIKK
jgi:hypothetical protein